MAKHVTDVVCLDFVGLRQCLHCQQVVWDKAVLGCQPKVWNEATFVLPTNNGTGLTQETSVRA